MLASRPLINSINWKTNTWTVRWQPRICCPSFAASAKEVGVKKNIYVWKEDTPVRVKEETASLILRPLYILQKRDRNGSWKSPQPRNKTKKHTMFQTERTRPIRALHQTISILWWKNKKYNFSIWTFQLSPSTEWMRRRCVFVGVCVCVFFSCEFRGVKHTHTSEWCQFTSPTFTHSYQLGLPKGGGQGAEVTPTKTRPAG